MQTEQDEIELVESVGFEEQIQKIIFDMKKLPPNIQVDSSAVEGRVIDITVDQEQIGKGEDTRPIILGVVATTSTQPVYSYRMTVKTLGNILFRVNYSEPHTRYNKGEQIHHEVARVFEITTGNNQRMMLQTTGGYVFAMPRIDHVDMEKITTLLSRALQQHEESKRAEHEAREANIARVLAEIRGQLNLL